MSIRAQLLVAAALALAMPASATNNRADPNSAEVIPVEKPASLPSASVERNASASGLVVRSINAEYLGSYCADGVFRKPARMLPCKGLPDDSVVPSSIDRDPVESVVNDMARPARAVAVLKGESKLARLRDRVVTVIYGRPQVIGTPAHIVTDSRGRVIISDPRNSAIHVLDGALSFRIQGGGPRRNLQLPAGVATDGKDNIYVIDNASHMILVYDPRGHYLRSIGMSHGEKTFEHPEGIAIDVQNGRLYVLDSPVHELVVLDLEGNLLKRVGGHHSDVAGVNFEFPVQVAARDGIIVVADMFGSRIHVLDDNFKVTRLFNTHYIKADAQFDSIGLALDAAGNVYVTKQGVPDVSIYDGCGRLVARTETTRKVPRSTNPAGIWLGPTGRMYVTDFSTSRIDVFRLVSDETRGD